VTSRWPAEHDASDDHPAHMPFDVAAPGTSGASSSAAPPARRWSRLPAMSPPRLA
jgi:hypothetical protein